MPFIANYVTQDLTMTRWRAIGGKMFQILNRDICVLSEHRVYMYMRFGASYVASPEVVEQRFIRSFRHFSFDFDSYRRSFLHLSTQHTAIYPSS